MPLEFSGTWSITVAPSRNVTIPVGVPAPEGTPDTVAANETGCPVLDGLGEELSEVVDALAWTFCIIVANVEA